LLDLSDNDLKDQHGSTILKFLKVQAERRDKDLWELSLRQSQAESHLKKLVRSLNMVNTYEDKFGRKDVDRELDSQPAMKRLLNNLDNSEMQTHKEVL